MTGRLVLNTTATQQGFARLRAKTPIAIARALNRSITSGKTVMVRAIAADLRMKQSDVRDNIGTNLATAERHVAQLTASPKRIPIIDFGAKGPEPSRGKGRGVTARIGGAAKGRYPNAFITTMQSGHRGVFQRKGKTRLPIYELFGPSIAHVFEAHVSEGLAKAQEVLAKNLAHELKFALTQAA